MGVRLYNPDTYPVDAINQFELNGDSSSAGPRRHGQEAKACLSFGIEKCAKARRLSRKYQSKFGGSDKGDLLRHFIWQITLAQIGGEKMTRAIGNAHEYRIDKTGTRKEKIDSKRDLENNRTATTFWNSKKHRWLHRASEASIQDFARKLWRLGFGVRL